MRKRGIMSHLMRAIVTILLLGLLVALMRAFNFDPFGIISWLWDHSVLLVIKVADLISGNDTFRQIVSH